MCLACAHACARTLFFCKNTHTTQTHTHQAVLCPSVCRARVTSDMMTVGERCMRRRLPSIVPPTTNFFVVSYTYTHVILIIPTATTTTHSVCRLLCSILLLLQFIQYFITNANTSSCLIICIYILLDRIITKVFFPVMTLSTGSTRVIAYGRGIPGLLLQQQ